MLLNVSLSLVYDFISKHYSNNQPINQTIQNTSFKGSPDSPSIFPVWFESSIRTLFWRRSFSSHTADKKPIKVGYSGKVWGFKPQKGKPSLDFEKHSTFFTFKKSASPRPAPLKIEISYRPVDLQNKQNLKRIGRGQRHTWQ